MNWKELRDKIDKMPLDVQEQEVKCCGDDMALTPAMLEVWDEDMYYSYNWDNWIPKSELEPEDKEDTSVCLCAKKGTYFLWVE